MFYVEDRLATEKPDFLDRLPRHFNPGQQRQEVVMARWTTPIDRRRTCPTCKKEFLRPYTAPKQRFCSKSCADAAIKCRPIAFTVDANGCFVVTSHKAKQNGYPSYRGEPMHRHIYKEQVGDIPAGHVVRHKCDNRMCINPAHLETGTQAQNWGDMLSRNRNAKGVNIGAAKLTPDDVRAIRNSHDRQIDLAIRYGVRQCTISCVIRRTTWRHVA